jgi:integrase
MIPRPTPGRRFEIIRRGRVHVPRHHWTRPLTPLQTKREAEAYEREVRRALVDGTWGKEKEETREVPTLAEFAKTFIDVYATNNNRASTVREKRRTLGRGLLRQMGGKRLDEIGTREIEAFKAMRKSEGVGNKTINEELAVLSKLLDFANEIGDLPMPPPKIRRLKTQPPRFDFYDFDEAERLVEKAKDAPAPWCAMIPVALWSGLRLSELRALQWDDVDLVAARLHVRRSADDEGELGPPKNYRSRVVDLPRRAVAILRAHKHLRGPFVFCREDGSILQRWHCESKSKKKKDDSPLMKACRKAGLRRIGWHGLRHTYASHLVMRGANLMEVKELLGHSSIQMTMRYAHLSPSARKAAVALLDEATPRHPDGTLRGSKSKNGV